MAQITLNSSGVASSGSLLLQTNGTTTQATVDTSGNLGLGVTPSAWATYKALQVGGAAVSEASGSAQFSSNYYRGASNDIYINTNYALLYRQVAGAGQHQWFTAPSGTAGNAITFTQAMTLDASGNLGVGITSPNSRLDVVGGTGIRVNEDGASTKVIQVRSNFAGVGPAINVATNDPLLLQTNNTERARIDTSGNLLVGLTSGGDPYRFRASTNSGTTIWQFGPYSTVPGNYYVVNGAGTGVYITSGNTSWSTVSDERIKDIIEPISNALDKVSNLRTVIGKYKTDEEGTRRSFLIAQDVLAVFPEAVNSSNPDELAVQYTETIPLLVAAIKEQQAIITQLQADVAALKG